MAHTGVFGVLVPEIKICVCLFVCSFSSLKHAFKKFLKCCFKNLVIWEGDPVTTTEGWGKLQLPTCTSKYKKNFFLLCFYQFYQDSTFLENLEETLKIEEYSSPWYCIDLSSSNFWKKKKFWRRETSFFENILWQP